MRAISKKVCLLGEFAVGKTSLVRRFVYDRFDDQYISTIGVKVSRKTVVLAQEDEVLELTMMLWDLAGSNEFSRVRASYLRGAAGAVLVCDLTRPETLDRVQSCAAELLRISPRAQTVLAANTCDLAEQRRISEAEIERTASVLGAAHYRTSAKTGQEIEALFRHLGQLLVV